MKTLAIVATLLMGSLATTPANAAVQYVFTANSSFTFPGAGSVSGSFTYVAPGFITATTTAPLASLSSCAAFSTIGATACVDQVFYEAPAFGQANTVAIAFGTTNVAPFYYFAGNAFTTFGTFQTVLLNDIQSGTLVVSDFAVGGIPEPASWAMLVAGFGLVGAIMRRRAARVLAA